jgi:hypothetical protein
MLREFRQLAGDVIGTGAAQRRQACLATGRSFDVLISTFEPLLAAPGHDEPLDLSHSVLRSVTPVHIEYLGNMGVRASMSVSIVIAGRLWGMLACHHMAPLRVPYATRQACDVMAQLIAASVLSLDAREREAGMGRAAALRTGIAAQIAQGHEAIDVLAREAGALCDSLGSVRSSSALMGGCAAMGPSTSAGRRSCWACCSPRSRPWCVSIVARSCRLPAANRSTAVYSACASTRRAVAGWSRCAGSRSRPSAGAAGRMQMTANLLSNARHHGSGLIRLALAESRARAR